MGNDESSVKSPARLKRVKRLKRMIVGTVLALIIIPTVLCIILGVRIHFLKSELENAKVELNYYMELLSEASFSDNDEATKEDIQKDNKETPQIEESVNDKESSSLNKEDVDKLTLTTEELYDGYRKVYLTFDDGPSSNTDRILDVLNQYGVKATFFVVKREGRNNEKLYQRIVDEGHSLGLHSCTHIYRDLYSSVEAFNSDTQTLRNFLYMVTGVESDIYRFPGGSSNRVSSIDMHVFADELSKEGIAFYDWNISSQDASSIPVSKNQIVSNVVNSVTKFDESMILFHDLGSKDTTVEALPEIIEYILSLENTVILPISSDTKPVQHLSVNENDS